MDQKPVPAAIRDGERLSYTVNWRLWKAGEATLALSRAGTAEEVQFTAQAVGEAAVLYPLRDRRESYFDPVSFCAEWVSKNTREGNRQRRTRITYHTASKQVVLQETNLDGPQPRSKRETAAIPGCVLDALGALYYARNLPLKIGETYHVPINEGGATVMVRFTPDRKENVTTPAGTFTALHMEPTVEKPADFHAPGRLWIWLSDDARHLPVKVQATTAWGTLTALLTHYSDASRR